MESTLEKQRNFVKCLFPQQFTVDRTSRPRVSKRASQTRRVSRSHCVIFQMEISACGLQNDGEKQVLDLFARLRRSSSGILRLSFRTGFDILSQGKSGGVARLKYSTSCRKPRAKQTFGVSSGRSLEKGEWIGSDRVESKST